MAPDNRDAILRALGAVQNGRGWKALCPYHDDHEPSLDIDEGDGKLLFVCRAGCPQPDVMAAVGRVLRDHGLSLGDSPDRRKEKAPQVWTTEQILSWQSTAAVYVYEDEHCRPIIAVRRTREKDFKQYHAVPGGWLSGRNGTRDVPFHLPELFLAVAAKERVHVVEGEKDVQSLERLGLAATCNPGGAGKWKKLLSQHLHGADVVILPDNDEAGEAHALKVARLTHGVAASVRIVRLPDLPPKGDVSDWMAAGGTRGELERLVAETSLWEPAAEPEPQTPEPGQDDPRPAIMVTDRHLHEVTAEAIPALADSPHHPYQRAGVLVEIRADDEGARIVRLSEAALRGKMDRSARWLRQKRDQLLPTAPPLDNVRDLAALSGLPFPVVERVVGTPVVAPDGTIDTTPGYQPAARVWYDPAGLVVPPVPERPTAEDLARGRALLQEVLCDFRFADEASYAHAVSLALDPIIRPLYSGPPPLRISDASTPGTGKTLVVEAMALMATGRALKITPPPREEEETRKKMTAELVAGAPYLCWDNISRRLDSGALATYLTSEMWSDRVLGSTTAVDIRPHMTLIATGNNLRMSNEITRRSILIRQDAQVERPEDRTGFRHSPLLPWIREHRGDLVWALLTMVRAWLAAGRPHGAKSIGSYEEWAAITGGILQVAGIPGFLENLQVMRARSDEEMAPWRDFVAAWADEFGTRAVGVADLYRLAEEREMLVAERGDGNERSQRSRLGRALKRKCDRVIGGWRFDEAGTGRNGHGHAQQYRLVSAGPLQPSGTPPSDPPPQEATEKPSSDGWETFDL